MGSQTENEVKKTGGKTGKTQDRVSCMHTSWHKMLSSVTHAICDPILQTCNPSVHAQVFLGHFISVMLTFTQGLFHQNVKRANFFNGCSHVHGLPQQQHREKKL